MKLRTGIIIQARMGSTRLPNKIMLSLSGKPVLWHVFQRCKKADVDKVVIATSVNKENDIIEQFCRENGCSFYRGSEEDVLDRYYNTAKEFKLDVVVRITSDCPLISPEVINECINLFKQGEMDYVSNASKRSFPRGLDVEVFSFKSLEKANSLAKDKLEREHVTSFIYNHPDIFKLGNLVAVGLLKRPNIRICLDTKEDFELLKNIYDSLYKGAPISIFSVMDYLERNPHLVNLNKNSEQEHLARSSFLKQKFIK